MTMCRILFELKTYDFFFTWIENNMDAVCLRYVRTWLELPVNACRKEVLSLPKNRAGLGISSYKSLAEKNEITKMTQP